MYEGTLVRLRAFEREDIKPSLAARNDWETTRTFRAGIPYPMTEMDMEKIAAKSSAPEDFLFAVETLDGRLVGTLGVHEVDWKNARATLYLMVHPEERGKGYGKDALRVALRFLFAINNFYRVGLTVFSFNERAIRLYESIGFRREGVLREALFRDGKRHDIHLMGILRSEWENGEGAKC